MPDSSPTDCPGGQAATHFDREEVGASCGTLAGIHVSPPTKPHDGRTSWFLDWAPSEFGLSLLLSQPACQKKGQVTLQLKATQQQHRL
ncbi:hypothetical protein Nepgr_024699 [Nepenthes gracilis]|uniref:Uncharacterized protein n=1 Tax=Nepenthes gracilis TaxID=150966 RepID=A0AAD3T585_NEPGR|nr:hypothetical protein Nepgr_024699 [Nepenthes gracilis]